MLLHQLKIELTMVLLCTLPIQTSWDLAAAYHSPYLSVNFDCFSLILCWIIHWVPQMLSSKCLFYLAFVYFSCHHSDPKFMLLISSSLREI